MSQPFDVNAARTQRIEEIGRTWSFTIDEDTFELPTELTRSTAKALRKLDDNDVDGLLSLLMGAKQFARFEKHDVTMQDIATILEAYGTETGLGPGGNPMTEPMHEAVPGQPLPDIPAAAYAPATDDDEFARPFRLHHRGRVLDGAAFPSCQTVIVEDPSTHFVIAAPTLTDLLRSGYHNARIEWAPEPAAALDRVRERCQAVHDRVGPSGMINASQILELLSPTWPDGNHEAPAPGPASAAADDARRADQTDAVTAAAISYALTPAEETR